MDRKDRQIIRELQANARLTNQELSERVALSPSPCLRRVRTLESDGIVTGYTALVDEAAFGLPLTVFVRVSLARHDAGTVRDFEAAVRRTDAILECYLMTGGSDYQLKVLVADLATYERFVREVLHHLPGVASIDTSFAYGRVKRATVFPRVRSEAAP